MPASLATPSRLTGFCSQVLSLHKGIRFTGIADDDGELIGFACRKGLQPLLTKDESELPFLQSLIRMGTHTHFESKFGGTVYSFTMYGKVKRATIPIKRSTKGLHLYDFV